MIRWALAAVVLSGCDALFDLDHLAGPSGDGGGDVFPIDPDSLPPNDGRLCVGKFLSVCPPLTANPTFDTVTTINTSNDVECTLILQAPLNYPEVCVIGGASITINANVTVIGLRALAFAAIGTIRVTQNGVLDASSTRGGQSPRTGPAANADTALGCTPSSGDPQTVNNGGGGGGAGGSFGGTGGRGGLSDNSTSANSNPAVGPSPTSLRGGCSGGFGGESIDANSKGLPGDSGGALLLVAGNTITIGGVVMANGGGGVGGGTGTLGQHAGGGGGGSGGMIVLEAPNISALSPGLVVAQSGGGGGGADGILEGGDGGEWGRANPTVSASGGIGGGGAGDGGPGSSAASVNGGQGQPYDANAGGGAGGGGGGAGLILERGTVSQGSQFYPAPRALQ